jgi:hypothetical protein
MAQFGCPQRGPNGARYRRLRDGPDFGFVVRRTGAGRFARDPGFAGAARFAAARRAFAAFGFAATT